MAQNQGGSLCPISKYVPAKTAPLEQWSGCFAAVWEGWTSTPPPLEPVCGLWPAGTDSPGGSSGDAHQRGGRRGRRRRMWRGRDHVTHPLFLSLPGPDSPWHARDLHLLGFWNAQTRDLFRLNRVSTEYQNFSRRHKNVCAGMWEEISWTCFAVAEPSVCRVLLQRCPQAWGKEWEGRRAAVCVGVACPTA